MTDPRFRGRTYTTPVVEVTEESIRAYMRAVGDEREEGDLVAPPTYAMVFGFDAYRQLWTDPEVALDVAHLVHGEQRFQFHRPVRPGDRLTTIGRIEDIHARGAMEFVDFHLSASDAAGRPVCEASALFVIRSPQ
ncbi:MAG TPA: MaoC family dehydratase N-terminal domain-containing protein [Candidatus Limnocylindrales bacterium]|nr:MaoC family dehydratase N-terminal domain-containing protein [Candidatus Limnocylindrales bacterium]